MYLLLVIFAIYNLNDVSWGTREVAADAVNNKVYNKFVKIGFWNKIFKGRGKLYFVTNPNHNIGSY